MRSRSTSRRTPSRTASWPRRWRTTRSPRRWPPRDLKDAKREGSDPEEIKALQQLLDLYGNETAAKKAAKEAQAALDLAVLKKYGGLVESDVKSLVLGDKWKSSIALRVAGELNVLILALVDRIQQLGERYDATLSDIEAEVQRLNAEVKQHLAKMGIE